MTAPPEPFGDVEQLFDNINGQLAFLGPAGEVLIVSRQILEYTGQTLAELQHWATSGVVHPEDMPYVAETFGRSMREGTSYDLVQRMRRFDGAYRWFRNCGSPVRDESGGVVQWVVLLTDIDDQTRAEDATRARERELQLIIDTIPALAWSARTDGSAEFFNQHYLQFIGFTAEQASGWGWAAAVHPDDLSGLAAAWEAIRASEALGEAEARMRRHDGEYRWFLFRTNPLRDENGAIVKWYGINTDIGDRKRAEQERERAEAELRRAGSELAHVTRATTLSALAASIAHEINQPLAGILTNANTCVRMLNATHLDVDGACQTATRTIRDVNRALEVIARLRALFSKEELTLEPVDLNDATEEVIALAASDLQKNRVDLQAELAPDLPVVNADRIQIQQVILNLLRNASDAMAEVTDRPRRLEIATRRDGGDHVCLSVRDAGVGLPSTQGSGSLFDAFYTTKSDGMGIGLFVSRSIVERHRGRLWAESNAGTPGAMFAFSVPCGPQR